MSNRVSASMIMERAHEARKISESCELCPRHCRVDRTKAETGHCKAGLIPTVAAALSHFGEEPPICGPKGAGAIFFSMCNMDCVYCQNHQISHGGVGHLVEPEDLAKEIRMLWEQNCSCIEPISPTPHLPGLLKSLSLAKEAGVDIPIVYNTNSYEDSRTLDILDGVVDIFLPDLRYASDDIARCYSNAPGYVDIARKAILRMHAQVGALQVDEYNNAVSGLIIRLLVLPDGVAGVKESLLWIKDNLPITTHISLMAQYAPLYRAADYPRLNRRISAQEYDDLVDFCWDLGFENAFVQDLSSQDYGIPDFRSQSAFSWDQVDM